MRAHKTPAAKHAQFAKNSEIRGNSGKTKTHTDNNNQKYCRKDRNRADDDRTGRGWTLGRILAAAATAILIAALGAAGQTSFDSGTGTQTDPYVIVTAEQLAKLADLVNNGAVDNDNLFEGNFVGYNVKYYELRDNINLDSPSDPWLGMNDPAGWMPIGTFARPFCGSLYGNSHTISGLNIDRPTADYVGLFGVLGGSSCANDMDIQHLLVIADDIRGKDYTGGLAGLVGSTSHKVTITCRVEADTVGGMEFVGGLIGRSGADGGTDIIGSSFSGAVGGMKSVGGLMGGYTGSSPSSLVNIIGSNVNARVYAGGYGYAGGLVGDYNNGHGITFTSCLFDGSVTGTSVVMEGVGVGGLMGFVEEVGASVTITGCNTNANVTANNANSVGGMVGGIDKNNLTISQSRSAGKVEGKNNAGGLIGSFAGTITLFSECTSSVKVEGSGNNIGGLVGQFSATSSLGMWTITDCRSDGSVTGTGATSDYVGGLVGNVGDNGLTIVNSHASGNVEGNSYIGGLLGNNGAINRSYTTGDVTGRGNNVGGLAGYARGGISGSYATGNVNCNGDYAGGLVGQYHSSGTIVSNAALNNSVRAAGGNVGRVAGVSTALLNNFAFSGMTVTSNGSPISTPDNASGIHGAGITAAAINAAPGSIGGLFEDNSVNPASPWTVEAEKLPGFGAAVPMPGHLKPGEQYIITAGSAGNTFSAAINGSPLAGAVNQPIQTVINAIRTNADGGDCEIMFGDGTSTVDIESANLDFNGSALPGWGNITLTGRLTSSNTNANGTIYLRNGVSMEIRASVDNTSATASAITVYTASTGTLTVSSGAAVTADAGRAIYNESTGAVDITGGTVSATSAAGIAVFINNTGKVTVSGAETVVTSINNSSFYSTIYIANTAAGSTDTRLEINGGTVRNTATNAISGRTIHNASNGAVTVTDGTVILTGEFTSNSGCVIYSQGNGDINISGGTISATTTGMGSVTAISKSGGGATNISGGEVTGSIGVNLSYYSTGPLNITDGTITATDYAIYNYSTSPVNMSGGRIICTAAAAATGYAIYNYSTGAVTVTGGEISAKADGAAYAIYNYSTGAVTVTGGEISAKADGAYAIYNATNSAAVTLGGNPTIVGPVLLNRDKPGPGGLNVFTTGDDRLSPSPANKAYNITLNGAYYAGDVAVAGGGEYIDNFKLTNLTYVLEESGGNLVLKYVDGSLFTTGDGTPGNPYMIETATQLAYLAEIVNKDADDDIAGDGSKFADKHYALGAGINLGVAPYNEGAEWMPIGGTYSQSFRGVFDGRGYEVTGMRINRPDVSYQGLFGFVIGGTVTGVGVEIVLTNGKYVGGVVGYVGDKGSITNCHATGSITGGSGAYMGGVAGYAYDNCSVTDCYFTGTITGSGDAGVGSVGGVVGRIYSDSRVTGCYFSGAIDGDYHRVGGVAGYVYRSFVTNSHSAGTVKGSGGVGGVVGLLDGWGEIDSCHSTAKVNGTESYVGGVVGDIKSSNVKNSYSTGDVSSTSIGVGGVVGYLSRGDVTNCYSTGAVSGRWYVGGVVGSINNSDVANCYSTGAVSGREYVGGVTGFLSGGDVTNCYSTGTVSGGQYVGGVVGYLGEGNVTHCAALNDSVKTEAGETTVGRVAGIIGTYYSTSLGNNIAYSGMTVNDAAVNESETGEATTHGESVSKQYINNPADRTLGGRFTGANGWTTAPDSLPGLFGQAVAMPDHLKLDDSPGTFFAITKNTGNNTFEVTKDGEAAPFFAGANIQAVIDAIRGDADGGDCEIRFGDGGADVLDIGDGHITFDALHAHGWGEITLSGSLRSTWHRPVGDFSVTFAVVKIENGVTVTSTANIENAATGVDNDVFDVATIELYNNAAGALTIDGGTISGANEGFCNVIHNYSGGAVIINSGARVIAAGKQAITGGNGGTVTVNAGAEVSAADEIAINSTGTVVINAGAEVSAKATTLLNGRNDGGSLVDGTLIVNGGKITAEDWNAIGNVAGDVTITGGEIISGKSGTAIGLWSDAQKSLTLGGSPDIQGGIYIESLTGCDFSVIPAGDPGAFAPAVGKKHIIDLFDYAGDLGEVVVRNGAGFIGNFEVEDSDYKLVISNDGAGNDLVLASAARRVLLIHNAGDLAAFAALVNGGDSFAGDTVRLADNIDLSVYNSANTGFNGGKGWIPIGWFVDNNDNALFRGTFDGDGYEVRGLYINDPALGHAGLFGRFDNGTVRNLGVVGIDISAKERIGGIAGGTYGGSVINCYTGGTLAGTGNDLGGLVGQLMDGEVSGCYSSCKVGPGNWSVGGLVGWADNGASVKHSAALNPSVSRLNAGSIEGTGRILGIDGSPTLDDNVAFSGLQIRGRPISSHNDRSDPRHGNEYSLNAADIRAIHEDGTIGGRFTGASGWITANGSLPGLRAAAPMPDHLKRPAWHASGDISNAAELAEFARFVNDGYDSFEGQTITLVDDINLSAYGSGYNGGKGWVPIGWHDEKGSWQANEHGNFRGVFDGGGNTVYNLYVNDAALLQAGLFGYLNGSIENLYVEGMISGGRSVGGVAGRFEAGASVENCSFSGAVSGINGVGGIVGGGNGVARHCYSAGTVTGANGDAGGVAGGLWNGSVIGCYSTAYVSCGTEYNAGGIVGWIGGDAAHEVSSCVALNPSLSGKGNVEPIAGGIGNNTSFANNAHFSGIGIASNDWRNGNDRGVRLHRVTDIINGNGTLGNRFTNGNNGWTVAPGSLPGLGGAAVPMPGHITDYGSMFACYSNTSTGCEGLDDEPFLIDGEADLRALEGAINSGADANAIYSDKHYRLTDNITLTGTNNWTPIGASEDKPFRGKFYGENSGGDGCEISGLHVSSASDYVGLFGYINLGTVEKIGVVGTISGGGKVGGITGSANNTSIANCYTDGAISGTGNDVGGIVGQFMGHTISNCYSTASLHTATGSIGGLAGWSNGSVTNSAALNPSVHGLGSWGAERIAGGVGGSAAFADNIAFKGMTVNNATVSSTDGASQAGADITASAINNDGTIDGLFEDVNDNPASPWTTAKGSLPGFGAARTMPAHLQLTNDNFCGGTGSALAPYAICDADQLAELARLVNGDENDDVNGGKYADKHYVLDDDIDLSGYGKGYTNAVGWEGWMPIGERTSRAFRGVFDGNGKTIKGLYIEYEDVAEGVGVFGYVIGATIKNLSVTDAYVNVYGNSWYVGSVAGFVRNSDIDSCHSTGTIAGSTYVGGVLGFTWDSDVNDCGFVGDVIDMDGSNGWGDYGMGGVVGVFRNGRMSDCRSEGTVSGKRDVGGVVGLVDWSSNQSVVSSCYSASTVIGTGGGSNIGGVAGAVEGSASNRSLMDNCYSTGDVTGGSSSYVGGVAGYVWNAEVTNSYSTGAVSGDDLVGGVAGMVTAGSIKNSAALNESVRAINGNDVGRVAGFNNGATLSGNVAFNEMKLNGAATSSADATGLDGADITKATIHDGTGTLGGLFTVADGWAVADGKLPGIVDPVDMPRHLRLIPRYVVTAAGGIFTATLDGAVVGWPDMSIQAVIDGIKGDAGGEECEIQFGSGGADVLDVGTSAIWFNDVGGTAWGDIILFGSTNGSLMLSIAASVESRVNIQGFGYAIYHNGSGTVTVSDGDMAVTGAINAITLNGPGTLNISGGTVSADTRSAVYSEGASGRIVISGDAKLTSGNSASNSGTIFHDSHGILEILGGTVTNTSTGNAVYITHTDVTLGGNPKIDGPLRFAAGKLSVKATGADIFNPGLGDTYTLDFVNYSGNVGEAVVENGANFESNFELADAGYKLIPGTGANTGHLVLAPASKTLTIMDADELADFADAVNGGNDFAGWTVELGADIDLGVAPYNAGAGWVPIGNYPANPFSGTFDGKDFEVRDLYINDNTLDEAGLFGYVKDGTVKNLGVVGANITGKSYVGGIVAAARDNSDISNCYSKGEVSGDEIIGGVVGYIGVNSHVTNSYSTSKVSSSNNWSREIGGVAGAVRTNSSVTNCYSTGEVSGTQIVGGVVGLLTDNSSVTNSYSTGIVSATCCYVGGVLGLTNNANCTVANNAALNPSVTGSNGVGRVASDDGNNVGFANNIAFADMGTNGGIAFSGDPEFDGADVNKQFINTNATLGNRFTVANGWTLAAPNSRKLPGLLGETVDMPKHLQLTPRYVITGTGSMLTATVNEGGVDRVVGLADKVIQDVMGYIRDDIAGEECEIFFGDGSAPLDVGSPQTVYLAVTDAWGHITLLGSVADLTVSIGHSSISVESRADFTNTVWSPFSNQGDLTISGGTLLLTSLLTNTTVSNMGALTVSGGNIKSSVADGSQAVNNFGTMVVDGGKIEAAGARVMAIVGGTGSAVTISGTAEVTSSSTVGFSTILSYGEVEILGGTVSNTSTGNAVFANDAAAALVLGGAPVISGPIAGFNAGKIDVRTSGNDKFAPGSAVYTLTPASSVAVGDVIVVDGAGYESNFELADAGYKLIPGTGANSDHLVITPADHWRVRGIKDADELKEFADAVNGGEFFAGQRVWLAADINLSAYGSAYNGGKGWTPIGELSTVGLDSDPNYWVPVYTWPWLTFNYFDGTFDGENHEISGLYINNAADELAAGLFGFIFDGAVMNLKVSGEVNGGHLVGGIVGHLRQGTFSSRGINNCSFTGNVSGTGDNVAGLVGNVAQSTIRGSYVGEGKISSSSATATSAGGIMGASWQSRVESCYSLAEVSVNIGTPGGLAGWVGGGTRINGSAALNPKITSNNVPCAVNRIVAISDNADGTNVFTNNMAYEGMIMTAGGDPVDPADMDIGPGGLDGESVDKQYINTNGDFNSRFTSANGWTTAAGDLPGLFGGTVAMPAHLLPDPEPDYVIVNDGAGFKATGGALGGAGVGVFSAADIQDVINEITADAGVNPYKIRFGIDDSDTLDIGGDGISFHNAVVGVWWDITLSGNVKTSGATNTISATQNVSVSSAASVTNTVIAAPTAGSAIYAGAGAKVEITGGTITAERNAVQCGFGGAEITITGGTITATLANAAAVAINSGAGGIMLGGNPGITGRIWMSAPYSGKLSLITSGSDAFSPVPATPKYTIDLDDYSHIDAVVVTDGANFESNFALADADYKLEASGNNLVLKSASTTLVIMDADELQKFAAAVNSGSNDFKGWTVELGDDIILNDPATYPWTGSGDPDGWVPIGTNANPFRGTFDGKGNKVIGLRISGSNNGVGLFGRVGQGLGDTVVIRNVDIVGASVAGESYVGGLVGGSRSSGANFGLLEIDNCSFDGAVDGFVEVGGLVGTIGADIIVSNCNSNADVTGDYRVGGLVGYSSAGKIKIFNSHVVGDVTSPGIYVGGLFGSNDRPDSLIVVNSSVIGNVTGGSHSGGLVGHLNSTVVEFDNCQYEGNVIGTSSTSGFLGGLLGAVMRAWGTDITTKITNCNTVANVVSASGGGYVGGLAGTVESGLEVANSRSIGSVKSGNTTQNVGGLIGYVRDTASFTECTSSVRVEGTGNYIGGLVGYMREGGTIKNCRSDSSVIGWGYSVGGLVGYSGGNNILNIHNSHASGDSVKSHYIGLSANGTGGLVGDANRVNIIKSHASAVVEGHQNVGGLIGHVADSQSSIDSCYATGTVIKTSGSSSAYAGGLVGQMKGGITNSYATGDVLGDGYYKGGLVGRAPDVSINNCYATGNVLGDNGYNGGLVGYVSGSISSSYATGDVRSNGDYNGGLVGYASGSISNSYATGIVQGSDRVGGLVGIISGGAVTVINSAALNDSVIATGTGAGVVACRVIASSSAALNNNAAFEGMVVMVNGNRVDKTDMDISHDGLDGDDIDKTKINDGTVGGMFTAAPWTPALPNSRELPGLGGTVPMPEHLWSDPVLEYVIVNSGGNFEVTGGNLGAAFSSASITNVISAIRTDAGGDPCEIRFGSGGTDVLDIGGTTPIAFQNSVLDVWGDITLSGRVTSSIFNQGTVVADGNNITISSTANIENTSGVGWGPGGGFESAVIVENGASVTIAAGTVTAERLTVFVANGDAAITGGTVSARLGNAVTGGGAGGTFTISGGTITAPDSVVYADWGGEGAITGGTITATLPAGSAVFIGGAGAVTLGNDPGITGKILFGDFGPAAGRLIVKTTPPGVFASTQKYMIELDDYNNIGALVVTGGAGKAGNFDIANPLYMLADGTGANSNDLVLAYNTNVSYTVTFNSMGGSAVLDATVAHGGFVTRPPNPILLGHTFDAWYTENTYLYKWDFAADVVTGDTTLYANWTVDTYTVTFNSQGGSAVPPASVQYNYPVSAPVDPTWAGYTFTGWYTEPACVTLWNFSLGVTGNRTLYAGWDGVPIVGSPTIGGEYVIGGTLTLGNLGSVDPNTNLSYQWRANNVNIAGAVNTNYTITAADAGRTISCVVTSADAIGSLTAAGLSVPYNIAVTMVGNVGADNVTFAPAAGRAGDAITLTYTLSNATLVNNLAFSPAAGASVTVAGGGTRVYTVNGVNAVNGVITITATFTHSNQIDVSANITFANGSAMYNGSEHRHETARITGITAGANPVWTYTYAAAGGNAGLGPNGLPLNAGTYTVTARYEDANHIGLRDATFTVDGAPYPTLMPPTASRALVYGEPLSAADLTGGTQDVGSWAWEDGSIIPIVYNSGYRATFTPSDYNYSWVSSALTRTVAVTVTKAPGAAVAPPTLVSMTDSTILIAAPASGNEQNVAIAISATDTPPVDGWGGGLMFRGLTGATTYYIFARSVETPNFTIGAPSAALVVTTDSTPPVVARNALPPVITEHPLHVALPVGATHSFTVAAESPDNDGRLSYQWYRNTDNANTGGTAVAGATGTSYTVPTNTAGTWFYYAVVTNTIPQNNDGGVKSATAASSTAMLMVSAIENALPPTVGALPDAVRGEDGALVDITVTAVSPDGGALTFQWYRNETNRNTGGTAIAGATGATLRTPIEGSSYYCYVVVTNTIVDNGDGGVKAQSVTSNAARVMNNEARGLAGFKFLSPTSNKDLNGRQPDQLPASVLSYDVKVMAHDQFGEVFNDYSVAITVNVVVAGVNVARILRTDPATGTASTTGSQSSAAPESRLTFTGWLSHEGAIYRDTAVLRFGQPISATPKLAGFKFVSPTSNSDLKGRASDALPAGIKSYEVKVATIDQLGNVYKDSSVAITVNMMVSGVNITRILRTDPKTGTASMTGSQNGAVPGSSLVFTGSMTLGDGAAYRDTAVLRFVDFASATPTNPNVKQGGGGLTDASPAEFAAGPNPIDKYEGTISIYSRSDKHVRDGVLTVYDVTGNAVGKIKVSDRTGGNINTDVRTNGNTDVRRGGNLPPAASSNRVIGYWDLRDSRGRRVSEGTYLVRGVLMLADGSKEKVSLVVGVR